MKLDKSRVLPGRSNGKQLSKLNDSPSEGVLFDLKEVNRCSNLKVRDTRRDTR